MGSKQSLSSYLHMLGEEEEMPILMEKARKLLNYFVHILERSGCGKDEHFFQTLFLCETAIRNSTVPERSNRSVGGILSTLFKIIMCDYVCQNAINECLATISSILQCLDSSEVLNLPVEIKKKFSNLSHCWNKMDNLTTLKAIVRILYEYVQKFGRNDRDHACKQATEGFIDPTGKLVSIIQWTPESFENNCQVFLKDISGKQYYSLDATSIVLGDKILFPLPGCDFIYVEWNHNPAELKFKAAFASEQETAVQVNIALDDIDSLVIIEDMHTPRIECSYRKFVILGDSTAAYELRINMVNNDELQGLLEHVKHRIPLEKISTKTLSPVENAQEQQQKQHQLKNSSRADQINEAITAMELPNEEPEDPIPVVVIPEEPSRKIGENCNLSEPNYPPLSSTKWSFKLIDLSDDLKNNDPSYDPYDIAQLQKEDRNRKRTQKQAKGRQEACIANVKAVKRAAAPVRKRPASMVTSTPAKRARAAAVQLVSNYMRAMSPIYCVSDDTQSDCDDCDFVPYVMLSKAGQRHRNNKGTNTRRQSFPRAAKMTKRVTKNDSTVETKTNSKQNTFGRDPLVESSMNRIANSATLNSSNGIKRVTVEKAITTPVQNVHDTSLRSSGKNCDETITMGLVPFESATCTTPRATKENHTPMQSNQMPMILQRILNLERRYDDQMRCATNEAHALANKGSGIFKVIKEKYEKSMMLRAKWETCHREMMDIVTQGDHNKIIEELQRKRKEAEMRDKKLLLDLEAEKRNLKTMFQTSQRR